ncbi:MAG: hypothetical protein ACJAWT_001662 [Glaciecola sp.]|jgi:hypothetical protein
MFAGSRWFSLTEDGQSVYRAVINLFDSLNDYSLLVGTLSKERSGELVILCAYQLDEHKRIKLARTIEFVNESSHGYFSRISTSGRSKLRPFI